VILFGATGMVGQGVLRECLLDRQVETVLSVVRRASGPSLGRKSDKLSELVTDNFYDFSAYRDAFAGYDACLYCLGVSSVGIKAAEYRRVTYDIAVAAGTAVSKMNPELTLVHVSAAGTNVSGRAMWARVKGETENAMLRMPVKSAYVFRPFLIVPMHGIQSKTASYRVIYGALRPILPWLLETFPQYATTTEQLGRAMLEVARHGYPKQVLEAVDIASL
jgi:uncharacterized protein YbjT (DUF2867 family)